MLSAALAFTRTMHMVIEVVAGYYGGAQPDWIPAVENSQSVAR